MRLGKQVRRGERDQLGVGAVPGTPENLEVGPGAASPCPQTGRQDHDLLAGVPPHTCPVRTWDQRQRERVHTPPHQQVAPVERRPAQLDDDLTRRGRRVRDDLVAELAALVSANGMHQRNDAQGSSAETSTAA